MGQPASLPRACAKEQTRRARPPRPPCRHNISAYGAQPSWPGVPAPGHGRHCSRPFPSRPGFRGVASYVHSLTAVSGQAFSTRVWFCGSGEQPPGHRWSVAKEERRDRAPPPTRGSLKPGHAREPIDIYPRWYVSLCPDLVGYPGCQCFVSREPVFRSLVCFDCSCRVPSACPLLTGRRYLDIAPRRA